MPQNENLRALLDNARLVCLVKMDAVENIHGTGNAQLSSLHADFKKLFGHLRNPLLWKSAISYDRSIVASLVLDIDDCDPADDEAYLLSSRRFLDFLQDDLLDEVLESISNTQTSVWNLRMLNALRITLQQEDEREVFFKSNGHDLDNNAEFKAMKARQQALVSVFRELLITNGIESNEEKVSNMKTRGEMISRTEELHLFFRLYGKLSDYIQDQIEEAGAIPDPGDPPKDSMDALNALATTILKMEMKLDFFEMQGIDLTEDADYQTETARHPAILADFYSALQQGNLSLSEEDIDELADLGDSIQDDEEVADFTDHFRQLNELMNNAVAGLS